VFVKSNEKIRETKISKDLVKLRVYNDVVKLIHSDFKILYNVQIKLFLKCIKYLFLFDPMFQKSSYCIRLINRIITYNEL
jgi:hypothetical protein